MDTHESKPALTQLDPGHPQYVGPYDKNYAEVAARVKGTRQTVEAALATVHERHAPIVVATPIDPTISTYLDAISTAIQSWSKSTFLKSDVQGVIDQIKAVQSKLV